MEKVNSKSLHRWEEAEEARAAERQAKIDALMEICERLGISPEEAMAVGDGANDLGMLGVAGAGVALHAKPTVAAQAKMRIDHADLTALLYIQGYRRTDFAPVG